jgi:hypothetical protein
MTWSEPIGGTIVLPSDVDPDNPDRNYVLIGDEIPNEIASQISAGIVFRQAHPSTTDTDVIYYVLGINTSGQLIMSAYWQEWVDDNPTTGAPIFAYHLSSMLTLTKGPGNDDFPYLSLDAPGGVNSTPFNIFGDLTVNSPGGPTVPRITFNGPLNINYGGDAGINQASIAGLQIGANGTVTRMDGNEILALTTDLATGIESLSNLILSQPVSNTSQGVAASALTRKDYVDGLVEDTGWVTITTVGSWTLNGTPQCRRINGVVHMRNGWTNAGMTINAVATIGTLPVNYRPTSSIYGRAGTNTEAAGGVFVIGTDGNIEIRTGPTLASFYRLDAVAPFVIG